MIDKGRVLHSSVARVATPVREADLDALGV
jgi:hypothetical protein